MQRTANRRASAVLKLGRYIVRCLTAQPDIWFLFLYKCGQLVAVNLHEPVVRSVGILDELFQTQQQHHRSTCAIVGSSSAPSDVAWPEPDEGEEERSPDNDQNLGMDEDDDPDDGYTDPDDDLCAFLVGRRFTYGSSSGTSSRHTSSSGLGRSNSSGVDSRRSSLACGRGSCTNVGTGTTAAGTYRVILFLPPPSPSRTIPEVSFRRM